MIFRPRLVIGTNVCLALFLYPACEALRKVLSTHEMVAKAVVRSEWLRALHA